MSPTCPFAFKSLFECRTISKTLDYDARWGIDPMSSGFKSRGFELEDSQPGQTDRLERLVLIMALAMHRCVCVERTDGEQPYTA